MATSPSGTQITPPRVPLIDDRTGQIDRAWYLFFYNLFTGSNVNSDVIAALQSALQSAPQVQQVSVGEVLQSIQTAVSGMQADIDQAWATAQIAQLAPVYAPPELSAYLTPPSTITVTGSPFSYQNTTTFPASVTVQGGTVSKVEFSRDGTTWYDVGTVAGMFSLSPSDRLRVTYTVAPTMTLIPR
jgi:hypothetical protein